METLLVGLDGACLSVLEPLFERNDLPYLRSVFAEGASGPLESQIPPWTPSAWPSIYTGKNPGRHGVFDFLAFDGYDWDVVNATHVREPSIWELLGHYGVSSVVVNVPVTHPPQPFDGALVPGYVAPETPECHPPGLLEEITDAIGEYRVYPPRDVSSDEQVERYCELTRMRGDAFRYLADRFDPGFGFVEFQGTDTVFHDRPGDLDAVRAIYRAVDAEVGAILDEHDPENVLVVSDHGIGRYEEYEVRVNEFLRNEGFLEARRGGEGMPTWATVRENRLVKGDAGTEREPGLFERSMALAARFGVTAQRLERLAEAVGLADVIGGRVSNDVIRAAAEQVDFPRSRAYMRSRSELGVRIDLEGREPDGTVPRAEYEGTRADLIAALESVTTPEGDPVFEDVAPREEYFQGPMVDRAVDVVTVPREFEQFLSAELGGEVFGAPSEPWNHEIEGVIAAQGTTIDSTVDPEGAHLFDVAPTVLATFGLPRDERMDGTVLPIVEFAGERTYPAFESVSETPTDDSAVENRLADLGYIR